METVEEKVQLLSEEEEDDSTDQSAALGNECVVNEEVTSSTEVEEVEEEDASGSQLPEDGGRTWGRLLSNCWALQRRRWFVVETILLLKLTFPMVSIGLVSDKID